jgi:hypothetical protein
MPFDFNVDVKLTNANDPSQVQFINMTIVSAPAGVQQLSGEWRGAPVFVRSSGGDFDWDGRPGLGAFVFDGPANNARFVLGLVDFAGPGGTLPSTGATGTGSLSDPDDPSFTGDVRWEVT